MSTKLVNKILGECEAPQKMTSITHPIPRKNKANNVPRNTRGISISPVISKVLDSILIRQTQARATHILQYDFSTGKSSVEEALWAFPTSVMPPVTHICNS